MTNIDHRFKIIILGESNVGKTALLRKYKTDEFQESLMSTIGIDTVSKKINVNKKTVLLNIWDTAGQERFFSITKSYYRNADAIFLVFDLSVENTFKTVDRWYKNVKEESGDVPIFLIGNKRDLVTDTEYRNMEVLVKDKSKEINSKYFCTSAKYGLNVSKIFEEMSKMLIKRDKKYKAKDAKKIVNPSKKNKKRTCC
ncbi:hypothetical protein P3W45_000931 [Vairimorpha bombi]|jgi:Ras-related protein Rab-8A